MAQQVPSVPDIAQPSHTTPAPGGHPSVTKTGISRFFYMKRLIPEKKKFGRKISGPEAYPGIFRPEGLSRRLIPEFGLM